MRHNTPSFRITVWSLVDIKKIIISKSSNLSKNQNFQKRCYSWSSDNVDNDTSTRALHLSRADAAAEHDKSRLLICINWMESQCECATKLSYKAHPFRARRCSVYSVCTMIINIIIVKSNPIAWHYEFYVFNTGKRENYNSLEEDYFH